MISAAETTASERTVLEEAHKSQVAEAALLKERCGM